MGRGTVLVGLSLMLEADFLEAAYPLFAANEVDVLEWSFDVGWPLPNLPEWADGLLQTFSDARRLLGHGVSYSLLSADWRDAQEVWLSNLENELKRFRYEQVSEHFGFCAGGNFHQSAPLPVPLTETTLRIGRERLRRLAEVAQRPVGLENLAFAFGPQDVADQGRFLRELLTGVDGFLLLDLHNVYCQSQNFDRSWESLLEDYPLERVRELHISGGSWSHASNDSQLIRRDTHDGEIPSELFDWLPQILRRCPDVSAVVFERIGGSLPASETARFQADFRKLKQVVHDA